MTPLTRTEIEAAKARAEGVLKSGCYDKGNAEIPALADTALYWMERVKELTEALTPFASVELMPMNKDGTKPQDVYLWKPSSNTRDMLGINAAHILEARRVLSQLPAVAKEPQP